MRNEERRSSSAGRVPPSAAPGHDRPTLVAPSPPLELWAGVECTVNRVGDRYFDQVARGGHAERADDIDRLAALGARAVRYPVLWEHVAPEGLARADWRWADERLARLRDLGVRPIVGLLHHGSGPRDTSLVDPAFPARLARFARAVAERYPWVEDFTPVNEPLTTARFSGLYGLWYPHARDDRSFVVALLNQLRATRLAMEAIREVTPGARLVQTEDLGACHATPKLAYQAEFENARRWLTFDLLCGRTELHPRVLALLRQAGAGEEALAEFARHPCPPDVVGINHYLTSERFLDERLDRYPAHTHGGNGRHRYADVEAVRVLAEGPLGPEALLREVCERYALPVAVTEAHLGCTREQQMRWLGEVWGAARRLRDEGHDIRAVTLWSAFGAYDWASLLTRDEGHYEPGAFDVRSPEPRPTALARMARSLAECGHHDHPALDGGGWWRSPNRLAYPAVHRGSGLARRDAATNGATAARPARPLLITGATGTLGRALARACVERGLEHRLLNRAELDIANPASIDAALARHRPWAIVNAAGYVRVDDAERDRARCWRDNAEGPTLLAEACAARRIELATFSSDLVFDGTATRPYVESDRVAPLGAYGESKAAAERRVLETLPTAMVVRTSAFFGPWDEYNFVAQALRAIGSGQSFAAADDAAVSPTYVPDLVNATLDLLIDGADGLWHLANEGVVTWAELARMAAACAGLDANLVDGRPTSAFALAAARPRFSALASERAAMMPPIENAICQYLAALRPAFRAPEPLLASTPDFNASSSDDGEGEGDSLVGNAPATGAA